MSGPADRIAGDLAGALRADRPAEPEPAASTHTPSHPDQRRSAGAQAYLLCCPECSYLRHDASKETLGHNGFFHGPTLWHGRRSGLFFLQRRLCCSHGPSLAGGHPNARDLAAAWNAWATAAACDKATRYGWDAARTALFLYEMGAMGLDELLRGQKTLPLRSR